MPGREDLTREERLQLRTLEGLIRCFYPDLDEEGKIREEALAGVISRLENRNGARSLLGELAILLFASEVVAPEPISDPRADRNGASRRGQPETARLASRYHYGNRTSQRIRIGDAFYNAAPEGLTDEEVARIAGVALQSSPHRRRDELREDGILRDSGTIRITGLGSPATVWEMTPGGYLYWRAVIRGGMSPEAFFLAHPELRDPQPELPLEEERREPVEERRVTPRTY